MTTFSKENVLVLPELVYEDFLFKLKQFECLPCQTKCNLVQQNVFSIRQNVEILPKYMFNTGKYPKKSNSNQKHVICVGYTCDTKKNSFFEISIKIW
jgi:hypothetical protein